MLKQLFLMMCLIVSTVVTASADPFSNVFYGVCYSPYRKGESPDWTRTLNERNVVEDLKLLSMLTSEIRIYSPDELIVEKAQEIGLKVTIGTWMGGSPENDQAQLDMAVDLANRFTNINKILVGNEEIYSNRNSEAQLVLWVNEIKSQTSGVMVSTADVAYAWAEAPTLVEAVDFIALNIHPWWQGDAVADALNGIAAPFGELQQMYPNKEIVITETGWPTEGNANGAAVPGVNEQRQFLAALISAGKMYGIPYFVFSGFDEEWKSLNSSGSPYGDVESHWGIFDENRKFKHKLSTDFFR